MARLLLESLDPPKKKLSRIPAAQVVGELRVKYGSSEETETLSQKEWDESWKTELENRIADIESGKVKCIPYAEVRKRLNRILRKA